MNLAMGAAEELFGLKSAAVATQLFHTSLIYLRSAKGGKETELLDQAAAQLQQCLNIRSEIHGESEEVAAAAQLLGSVSFASGKYKEARKNFEKALLIRTSLARENPAVACSAHALGSLYARMPRRQEDAIALLGKAAGIRKDMLGEDSVHLADTLHELGSAIMHRQTPQSLQQALAYLSQAAAIREEKLGKRNAGAHCQKHRRGDGVFGRPNREFSGRFAQIHRQFQDGLGYRETPGKKSEIEPANRPRAPGALARQPGEL